jgi:uncharacterized protein
VDVDVADRPEERRFVASVDGEMAGHLSYRRTDDRTIILVHTEVEPAAEGKGVGAALARAALDEARARGLSVVPVCPFVVGWIARHSDYADLVSRPGRSAGSV